MKKIFLGLMIAVFSLSQDLNTSEKALQNQDVDNQEQSLKDSKRGNFIVGIFLGSQILSLEKNYYANSTPIGTTNNIKTVPGFSYALKFGYDFLIQPKHFIRFYTDYTGASLFANLSSGNTIFHNLTLNADYRYNASKIVDVFAGINGGGIFLDTQHLSLQKAFSAGVSLGLIFNIIDSIEIELRLRFISSTLKKTNGTPDSEGISLGATKQSAHFSDFINTSIGVGYKF
ncbi:MULTISPECIES: hypothetical protein [unclassified Helicobacter]|uniref:hypothetical protein n=1 Tax=unclassified Helicobacter TaxID=2593540 RepID=UPI000CF0AAC2|nr:MULTISPECIES: hypothetical protein [unclassified Helicobacter]